MLLLLLLLWRQNQTQSRCCLCSSSSHFPDSLWQTGSLPQELCFTLRSHSYPHANRREITAQIWVTREGYRHCIRTNFDYPQPTLVFHLLLCLAIKFSHLNLKCSSLLKAPLEQKLLYSPTKTFQFERRERNGKLITEGSEVVVRLQW